jgi:hypothetical protein
MTGDEKVKMPENNNKAMKPVQVILYIGGAIAVCATCFVYLLSQHAAFTKDYHDRDVIEIHKGLEEIKVNVREIRTDLKDEIKADVKEIRNDVKQILKKSVGDS